MFLLQLFEVGVFHADPHPGNLLVQPDGTIVLIDLGAIGRMGAGPRAVLLDLLSAAAATDARGMCDALQRMSPLEQRVDPRELEREVEALLDRHLRRGGRITASAFRDLTVLSGRFGLRLPRWFATVSRTLVTLEGTLRTIDPSFSLVGSAREHAAAHLRGQLHLSSVREARSSAAGPR